MIARRNASNIFGSTAQRIVPKCARINVARNPRGVIPQIVARLPVLLRPLFLDRKRAGGYGRIGDEEAQGDSDGAQAPPGVTFVWNMRP